MYQHRVSGAGIWAPNTERIDCIVRGRADAVYEYGAGSQFVTPLLEVDYEPWKVENLGLVGFSYVRMGCCEGWRG